MANSIKVDLDLDTLSAKNDLNKFEKKAAASGDKAGKSFGGGFTSGFKNILKGAGVVAILAGVVQAFRALGRQVGIAVTELRAFEREIANVNSILPKNDKLTKQSVDTFKQFAGTFASDTKQQAKAFYAVVSAGIKGTATQLKTLEVANQAAIAGLVDIEDATRVLVSSVNAYSKSGLTAKDASDSLFVAVREGQTTFGELANSLGNVTSIAQNAGVKFDELTGALAFITKSGIKTDIAVTGLRQVFASVIKPSKEAADQAKLLGLEFNKAAIESKGLAGFLKDVQDKTKGNETSLANLFGNVRALAPILNIVNGNFADFNRILGETANKADATAVAANEIKKSVDFKIEKATANFKLLRQELASFLLPTLGSIAETFTEWVKYINGSVSPADKLKNKIKELTTEIDGLKNSIDGAEFGLNRASVQITLTKNKITEMNKELVELKTNLATIENEDFIKTNAQAQLAIAEGNLLKLNEQLGQVKNNLAGLDGRSEIQLLGDINQAAADVEFWKMELAGLQIAADETKTSVSTSFILMQASIFASLASAARASATLTRIIREEAEAARSALEKTQKQVKNIMVNGVTRAISGGIQNVIQSIAAGENAIEGLGKFLLSTFGDLAIQLGEFYIAQGLANAALLSVDPTATIATGAALVALGSIMKAFAGSGGASASAPSGGGAGVAGGALATDTATEAPDVEERQTATVFNIEVQGSLTNSEELARFVTDAQNEAREKNGLIDTNVRIA